MALPHNILPPFNTMVAAGYMPGISYINKFGRNSDVDTTTVPEEIWGPGGVYTGFPSGSPETLEIFSSSAEDDENEATPPGTGAFTLRVEGLETVTSKEYVSEDVVLTGTTPVTTTKSFIRVNRAYVLTAGSTGANVGTITIRHSTTTSNVFAVMPATLGQSTIACWTVPAGNVFLLDHFSARCSRSANAATSATIALQIRSLNGAWRTREISQITNGGGISENLNFPIRVEGFADIRMRCTTVGNNDTSISGGFNGFYGLQEAVRDAMLSRASL